MEKLSVVIITLNEEEHLSKCLLSVQQVADEVLVLDSFSTDGTRDICLAAGASFHQHPFDGYISQKNRALAMASHNLVLSLDGDEALSQAAQDRILAIKNERYADAYSFKRLNHYCGKWMRHTSMYPDRKIRLFDRREGAWGGYDPHDRVIVKEGKQLVELNEEILHWVYQDRQDHAQKADSFAQRAATAYFEMGKTSNMLKRLAHTSWRYCDELLIRRGLLEGWRGWQFARLSAKYTYLKYKKLEQLHGETSR